MPHRIDLDFSTTVAVPEVERAPDGALHLVLRHRQDQLAVRLSFPSLEALSFEVTTALARLRRS